MRHTFFISDLHLKESDERKVNFFIDFLENKAVKAEALYILGDLFEFWVGDDDNSMFNEKIKKVLKKISCKTIIYLMRGNRDFLLGEKFVRETGCILVKDPCLIKLYASKVLITHGDIFCTQDISHIKFRKYAYNPAYNNFFLKLPLCLRKLIARLLRINSRNKQKKLRIHSEKQVSVKSMIDVMIEFGASKIIHGHTHIASRYDLNLENEKKGECIVLGEWTDKISVLEYSSDGICNLVI